jgi:hypothetical protein
MTPTKKTKEPAVIPYKTINSKEFGDNTTAAVAQLLEAVYYHDRSQDTWGAAQIHQIDMPFIKHYRVRPFRGGHGGQFEMFGTDPTLDLNGAVSNPASTDSQPGFAGAAWFTTGTSPTPSNLYGRVSAGSMRGTRLSPGQLIRPVDLAGRDENATSEFELTNGNILGTDISDASRAAARRALAENEAVLREITRRRGGRNGRR